MTIAFGQTRHTRKSHLTLYVSSKDRSGNDIAEFDRWIKSARHLFARLFGGCTVIPNATGIWYAEEDDVFIEETTAIIIAHVDRSAVITHLDSLRAFFTEFMIDTDQEAIAIEFDGDLHLIYAPPIPLCADPHPMTV